MQGGDHLLIDATERAYHRSTEDAKQRDHYSGKKKQHTLKNTVMSLPDKYIVFLGRTFSGRHHDYSMLKHEFPPELDWFKDMWCIGSAITKRTLRMMPLASALDFGTSYYAIREQL